MRVRKTERKNKSDPSSAKLDKYLAPTYEHASAIRMAKGGVVDPD
jgi:hypothetical protein